MAAIPGSAPILGSGAFTPAPIYAPTGTIGGSSPILPSDSFSKQPIGPIADTPLARQGQLGGQTPMDNDTMKRMMDRKPIKEQDPPCTTCKKKKDEEEEKKKKKAEADDLARTLLAPYAASVLTCGAGPIDVDVDFTVPAFPSPRGAPGRGPDVESCVRGALATLPGSTPLGGEVIRVRFRLPG